MRWARKCTHGMVNKVGSKTVACGDYTLVARSVKLDRFMYNMVFTWSVDKYWLNAKYTVFVFIVAGNCL